MPGQPRHKTAYPGVCHIAGTAARTGNPERIFYIQYRNRDGKLIEEKVTANRGAFDRL